MRFSSLIRLVEDKTVVLAQKAKAKHQATDYRSHVNKVRSVTANGMRAVVNQIDPCK